MTDNEHVETVYSQPGTLTTVHERSYFREGGVGWARRVVVFIFGLIQLLILLRFVLLIFDARQGNDIVAGIMNLSQLFVGPFEGMLNTNALHASGSVLDLAAIVALIGWTIVELIVFALLGLFRRSSTAG